MLEINQLSVCYDQHHVLQALNANWQAGCIHGLIGLNGSGKTTFFKALYGLLPFEGSIRWHGEALQKQDLAWLETQNYFYHYLTGKEYLQLVKPPQHAALDTPQWATLFGLPLEAMVSSYSTGMKKKLALMGILQQRRPLLLLDEPFNGIDLESSRLLSALLRALPRYGYTIIITSHLLDTIVNTCHWAHWLEKGRITRAFSEEELPDLGAAVFGKADVQIQSLLGACLEEIGRQ